MLLNKKKLIRLKKKKVSEFKLYSCLCCIHVQYKSYKVNLYFMFFLESIISFYDNFINYYLDIFFNFLSYFLSLLDSSIDNQVSTNMKDALFMAIKLFF